ncbi:MAG: AbrB/MazE/SpoVT family DNA-binding domain-containing protein [Actinobacteria bacterium]|nr:AbrB/MazE/SpoVT family DNA-binding domain-containing protein [Actinomycetota bacterium]
MIDHTVATSVGSEASIVRVTTNGSISLPASIRRRWGVDRVAVIDRGDLAIVRAVPSDPVSYFRGRFAGPGPNTDELRAMDGDSERASEEAKAHRVRQ